MESRWHPWHIMRTMLPVLLVLTVIELGSGLVLDSFEATLLRYPSLLVLVPTNTTPTTSCWSGTPWRRWRWPSRSFPSSGPVRG